MTLHASHALRPNRQPPLQAFMYVLMMLVPPQEECVGGGSVCGVCGKVFHGTNQKFLLRRHILTHTGERRHGCPYCSYQANQAGNLNRHIRNLHPGVSDTPSQAAARPLLPCLPTHASLTLRPTALPPMSSRGLLSLPLSPRSNTHSLPSSNMDADHTSPSTRAPLPPNPRNRFTRPSLPRLVPPSSPNGAPTTVTITATAAAATKDAK